VKDEVRELLEPNELKYLELVEEHTSKLGEIKGYFPGLLKLVDLVATRGADRTKAAQATCDALAAELAATKAALEAAKAPPT
jgi:hypothetical protein